MMNFQKIQIHSIHVYLLVDLLHNMLLYTKLKQGLSTFDNLCVEH